jgi:hypothetical protein
MTFPVTIRSSAALPSPLEVLPPPAPADQGLSRASHSAFSTSCGATRLARSVAAALPPPRLSSVVRAARMPTWLTAGVDMITLGAQYEAGGLGVVGKIGASSRVLEQVGAVESQMSNIHKELSAFNHFRTARLENTGRLATPGDHVTELRDFANGLRSTTNRLKKFLGDASLDDAGRARVQKLLGQASRLRDRINEVLRK